MKHTSASDVFSGKLKRRSVAWNTQSAGGGWNIVCSKRGSFFCERGAQGTVSTDRSSKAETAGCSARTHPIRRAGSVTGLACVWGAHHLAGLGSLGSLGRAGPCAGLLGSIGRVPWSIMRLLFGVLLCLGVVVALRKSPKKMIEVRSNRFSRRHLDAAGTESIPTARGQTPQPALAGSARCLAAATTDSGFRQDSTPRQNAHLVMPRVLVH